MENKESNKTVSDEVMIDLLQWLRDSFAPRTDVFFVSMAKVLREKNFSEKQLNAGIRKVIDTCQFHQLSIAAVMEACNELDENGLRKPIFY